MFTCVSLHRICPSFLRHVVLPPCQLDGSIPLLELILSILISLYAIFLSLTSFRCRLT